MLEEGDTGFIHDPSEWNDDLGISGFYVGQLIGSDFVADYDEDEITAAMRDLILEERKPLLAALVQAYGSDTELFIAMWNIHCDDDEKLDPGWQNINDNITVDKLIGYEWISSGCPVIY